MPFHGTATAQSRRLGGQRAGAKSGPRLGLLSKSRTPDLRTQIARNAAMKRWEGSRKLEAVIGEKCVCCGHDLVRKCGC